MQLLHRITAGLVVAILLTLCAPAALAQDGFVVRNVRVEGLQRISEGTLYNYLPINIGDRLDRRRVQESVKALYDTGFFRDIEFRREGDTLIIAVIERPFIENFTINGNKDIETEQLMESLRGVGLAPGRTFDRSTLDEVQQFLTDTYYGRGKYGVVIDAEVTELDGNKVDITIDIIEGKRARIRQINIVGNERYPDEEIIAEFALRTPNWLSFYKQDDRYDREALVGDIERLGSFYMDRGYANFQVESTQVTISPDKKDIFITINVAEGELYTISEIKLAGEMPIEERYLRALVLAKPGQTFSRKVLESSKELMAYRLGQDGYAFARIDPVPQINPEDKTVAVTYFVDPGNRVYVRNVNFATDGPTKDEVFRREMRQLEGGWLSNGAVDRSKTRLQRLPFVDSVELEQEQVPGSPDLVDLNINVKEGMPGQFGGGVGYSEAQKLLLNGNFTHVNFLGTGNRISAQLNSGKYTKLYTLSFTDPYTTIDGVARTISGSYRDSTRLVSDGSEFDTTSYTIGLNYGYPITEWQRISFGVDLQDVELFADSGSSFQIQNWIANNGNPSVEEVGQGIFLTKTDYRTYELKLGWTFDTRNRAIFATRGTRHNMTFSVTGPGSEVDFYTARYEFLRYWPLYGPFVFISRAEVAWADTFGDDTTDVPIFRNFFAGGPNSVRQYREASLGPLDTRGNPYGGNLKTVGQFEILLPMVEKFANQARLSLFYDVGNVFSESNVPFFDLQGNQVDYTFDASDLRMSTGLAVQWMAPLGMFRFSIGFPINDFGGDDSLPEDDTEFFQFSIGSAF